ncbi:MAG: outer membrane lipoprotein carrier protein LolA [Gammaproteobacteria bacterium]|nr:outer membrane lipoprotein carrier protein LolA [Gammaproteobacteria bacterium]|tara:strand:+ start:67972 stop:68661 length:690 start_codon:yes stop_codon:yes gene_type:complete
MIFTNNRLELKLKVNYIFCSAALLCNSILLKPAMAQEQSPLEELVAILAATETLQADVEQLILSQDGREIQELQAELVMQKPDRLYWHVTEPYEELMLGDGITLWYYEPDLEQVSIREFPDDIENNPILLLNDDLQAIADAYEVSMGYVDDEVRQYVLLPLTPSSSYERFSMTFAGNDLLQMQFESSVGQLTSFSFSNIVNNQAVDAGLFQFDIPAGIEIIDSRDAESP